MTGISSIIYFSVKTSNKSNIMKTIKKKLNKFMTVLLFIIIIHSFFHSTAYIFFLYFPLNLIKFIAKRVGKISRKL